MIFTESLFLERREKGFHPRIIMEFPYPAHAHALHDGEPTQVYTPLSCIESRHHCDV